MGARIDAEARISRELWATVRSDPLAQAALAAFALAAPAGLLPWLTAAQKERLIFTVLPFLFIGLAVAALRRGLGRLAGGERRFWNDLAIAFGAWLGVRILYFAFPGDRPLVVEILAETLFAVFYTGFVLALERQPHRTDRWRPSGLEGTLVRPAVALFVLGLAGYFLVVPVAFDLASYESLVPSMVLYLTLDLFLVARALLLVRGTSDRRWRALYAGLALVAALAAASDAVEYLGYRGLAPTQPLAAEPLWNLVFVVLVVTARLRHRPFADPHPAPTIGPQEEGYVPGPSTQTMAFALAFPLIHLACYSWGILGPPRPGTAEGGSPAAVERHGSPAAVERLDKPDRGEPAREAVVIGAILFLGAIAAFQHLQFSRRTRVLAEQRAQMEKALRKSESNLQLMRQRRKTREEVRQAEDDFLAFFRLGPGNRLISRLADGRVIEVNDNLVRALGGRREEIVGRTIEGLFRGAAGEERASISAALRSGKSVRDLVLELTGGSGGHARTVLLAAEPVELDGEPCLLSALCDLGTRRSEPSARDVARRPEHRS